MEQAGNIFLIFIQLVELNQDYPLEILITGELEVFVHQMTLRLFQTGQVLILYQHQMCVLHQITRHHLQ